MWAERAIGAVITQLFALQSLTIRYMFCCSVASCRTYVCIMETARRTVPVSRGADRPWRWPRSRLITSAVWTSTWARCVAYAGDVVAGAPYPWYTAALYYVFCVMSGLWQDPVERFFLWIGHFRGAKNIAAGSPHCIQSFSNVAIPTSGVGSPLTVWKRALSKPTDSASSALVGS
jgi:hypothetical protein